MSLRAATDRSLAPARSRLAGALERRLDRLRWRLVDRLIPSGAVDVRGARLRLRCDSPMAYFRRRTWATKEPGTLDWIDAFPAGTTTFFDVGANVGIFSIYGARRHPALRVVAFEPEYSNLHHLRDNILSNGLGDRVEPYAVALGDRSGLSRLHLYDLAPGSAMHSESAGPRERTDTGQPVVGAEGICVMRLDDFCAERDVRPDAIKIDVDGAERRVLEGGRQTLAWEGLRTVLIEIADAPADGPACAALLEEAGFARDGGAQGANQIWVRRAGRRAGATVR